MVSQYIFGKLSIPGKLRFQASLMKLKVFMLDIVQAAVQKFHGINCGNRKKYRTGTSVLLSMATVIS